MHRCRRCSVVADVIAERREIQAGQQVLARTEDDRGNREVHFVHEAPAQVLADGFDAAADANVSFEPAASFARHRAWSIPSVTKWKVVPPAISIDLRGW